MGRNGYTKSEEEEGESERRTQNSEEEEGESERRSRRLGVYTGGAEPPQSQLRELRFAITRRPGFHVYGSRMEFLKIRATRRRAALATPTIARGALKGGTRGEEGALEVDAQTPESKEGPIW